MHFQGWAVVSPALENHFQGQVVMSPAPGNVFPNIAEKCFMSKQIANVIQIF